MNASQKRVMYLSICIFVRLTLALLVFRLIPNNKTSVRYVLALFAVVAAAGFAAEFVFQTRSESVLGATIWWNSLRPVHALLYCMCAMLALGNHESAFVPLLADACVGLAAFLVQYGPRGCN